MKKLMLTSATILFIGLAAFAQQGGTCTQMCGKKCSVTECKDKSKCSNDCAKSEKGSKPADEKKEIKSGNAK
jgi:hypothetical protein